MKKITLILLSLFFTTTIFAQTDSVTIQEDTAYIFNNIVKIPTTSVKDQNRAGTCWAYAATSFVETELIRMKKPTIDLSEMYFVRDAYIRKAISYVSLHGTSNFSAGGQAHDVLTSINRKGFITEEAYAGLEYGHDNHNHSELDALLKAEVSVISKNRSKKINPSWLNIIKSTLDEYFGQVPETFTFEGDNYSPVEFQKEMNFNPDDYIEITSYNHHPFYTAFRLEIPDNWDYNDYYNVPIDDLMEIIDNAFDNGYSVCWDGDVSEKGFSHNKGVAIVPEMGIKDMSGTEKDKWQTLTEKEKNEMIYSFDKPVEEKIITQEIRQAEFNNHSATDDHLMHLTGVVEDQNGTRYYITKNSWNTDSNDFGGYLNMSTSYLRMNTVAIMVNKNAIPKKIRKKLNL